MNTTACPNPRNFPGRCWALVGALACLVAPRPAEAQCLGSAVAPTAFLADDTQSVCRNSRFPLLVAYKGGMWSQSGPNQIAFVSGRFGTYAESGSDGLPNRLVQIESATVGTPGCRSGIRWIAGADEAEEVESIVDLEVIAPSGTYSLTARAGGVQRSWSFTLPNQALPPAPALLNYAEAQQIDASQDFVVQLQADAASARTSIRYFPLGPTSAFPVLFGADCEIPSSTTWRIPARTLQSGTPYLLVASSVRDLGHVDDSSGPGLGLMSGSHTFVTIRTRAGTTTPIPQPPAIQIVREPQDVTVVAGRPAVLAVVATGPAPLGYQWSKNGSAIPGATGRELNFSQVNVGDAGTYTVTISAGTTRTASRAAVLVVQQPPTIVTPPARQSVVANGEVTFRVVAAGTGPFTYLWLKNGVSVAGGNGDTFSIRRATAADVANYSVIVSGVAGSVTSRPAALVVITAPTILTEPASQTKKIGSPVRFTVVAAANGTVSYQGFKDGSRVSGATGASYSISSCRTRDGGRYTVTISNEAGKVTSKAVSLTVKR